MRLALALFDHWSPVTHDFGLIHASVEVVSARYLEWQRGLGRRFHVTSQAEFSHSLGFLPPLSAEKRRCIFVPTSAGWTGFFQSGIQGSDPAPAMSHLTHLLGVDSMRVCCTPQQPVHPACIWEVYAPASRGGVPPLLYRRSISATAEDGRWSFEQSGSAFPFEDRAAYSARRKRDRFTPALLTRYLAHLGLRPFEADFFAPSNASPSILLERVDRWTDPPREFTLEEVRAGAPWRNFPDS
jgi:hypothetical protein